MLALMNTATSTELFLPSGATVTVPQDVLENLATSNDEFDAALRFALKAGYIDHADFLAGRDVIAGREPICLEMQSL